MAIQIRDLTIEYSSGDYLVRPIEHLDLDIADGEVVLVLGASGCGKTSLLSVLAAILSPAGGTVVVNDLELGALRGRSLLEYRRRTVGIVFQAFNLIPSLNAVEGVAAPLLLAGWRHGAARRRAQQLLALVGLADVGGRRPGQLSGGQQQRVAIARALAADPALVQADEPPAHRDYVQVDAVIRLLEQLRRPHRTIVIATHDDRLLPLADRVVNLTPRAVVDDLPGVHRSLQQGEILFRQGDPGDLVYVIESGCVELSRDRTDGTGEILATYGPGTYFGELAPLYGLRRSAGARATETSHLTGYSASRFRTAAGGRRASVLGAPERIGRVLRAGRAGLAQPGDAQSGGDGEGIAGLHRRPQWAHHVAGHLGHGSAGLADEVVVGVIGEVVHGSGLSEVHPADDAEALEGVEGPVDGREVHVGRLYVDDGGDRFGGHVVIRRGQQRLHDEASAGRHPPAVGPEQLEDVGQPLFDVVVDVRFVMVHRLHRPSVPACGRTSCDLHADGNGSQ